MAKSKKAKTHELLKRYIAEGKPVALRNEIIMLNYRLLCWIAKHYKVAGYAYEDDLFQDAFLYSVDYMENVLDESHIKYFSVRLFSSISQKLFNAKCGYMSLMTREVPLLYKEIRAFWAYNRENKDEWTLTSLDTFIENKYEELYGSEMSMKPTYFQERIDADEIAVEPKDFEIATFDDIKTNIYDICELKLSEREVMDIYLDSDASFWGEKRTTTILLFTDYAWRNNITVSAAAARFLKSRKHLSERLCELYALLRLHYTDNIVDICNENLKLSYYENEYKTFSSTPYDEGC